MEKGFEAFCNAILILRRAFYETNIHLAVRMTAVINVSACPRLGRIMKPLRLMLANDSDVMSPSLVVRGEDNNHPGRFRRIPEAIHEVALTLRAPNGQLLITL